MPPFNSGLAPIIMAALAVLDGPPDASMGRYGMRPDPISQAFERVCKAASIEGLTFRDLRHEATSRLFEKGLNPMEVAAITGHKTLQKLCHPHRLNAHYLLLSMQPCRVFILPGMAPRTAHR